MSNRAGARTTNYDGALMRTVSACPHAQCFFPFTPSSRSGIHILILNSETRLPTRPPNASSPCNHHHQVSRAVLKYKNKSINIISTTHSSPIIFVCLCSLEHEHPLQVTDVLMTFVKQFFVASKRAMQQPLDLQRPHDVGEARVVLEDGTPRVTAARDRFERARHPARAER